MNAKTVTQLIGNIGIGIVIAMIGSLPTALLLGATYYDAICVAMEITSAVALGGLLGLWMSIVLVIAREKNR